VLYEVNRLWALLAGLCVPILSAAGIIMIRTGAGYDRRLGVAALATVLVLGSWFFVAWVVWSRSLWSGMM